MSYDRRINQKLANRSPLEVCQYDGFSKHELDQLRPDLKSLWLPWLCIALVAVGATVWEVFWSSGSCMERLTQYQEVSFGMNASDDNDTALTRLLVDSRVSPHPVYSEEHDPLFPLTNKDYVGFGCAILGLMIAAGGGIGGGGILVPIYILILGFSPKHAIPLSNITVFGGALANTILNAQKRHPLADRPMIDWDLILVMEPLTIGGALIGAFLNKLLPERMLVVLLVILLSFTADNSLRKAIKMYKIESRHLREKGLRRDGTKESELTVMTENSENESKEEAEDILLKNMELQDGEIPGDGETKEADVKADETSAQELKDILEEERHVPAANIATLMCLFVVILAINLLKGGGAFPSPIGIKCGSRSFWMANAAMLGWILIISYFVRIYLVKRFETKQRVGYKYVEGDIQWDGRATIVYPCICCLAGFFAGMFGVGKLE